MADQQDSCKACGEPQEAGHAPYCASCDDAVQHLYQLWAEVRSCGCGWPGAAFALVRDLLALTPFYEHRPEVGERIGAHDPNTGDGDAGTYQVVLWALDRAGLTGHGTCIDGSWITAKGRVFLDLARRFGYDALDHAGYPHEGHGCTPDCAYWHAVREDYQRDEDALGFEPAPRIPNDRPDCECERGGDGGEYRGKLIVTRTGWDGAALDSYALSYGCPWHGRQAQEIAAAAARAFGAEPEKPQRHAHAGGEG